MKKQDKEGEKSTAPISNMKDPLFVQEKNGSFLP